MADAPSHLIETEAADWVRQGDKLQCFKSDKTGQRNKLRAAQLFNPEGRQRFVCVSPALQKNDQGSFITNQ